jgi:hypothetical protein
VCVGLFFSIFVKPVIFVDIKTSERDRETGDSKNDLVISKERNQFSTIICHFSNGHLQMLACGIKHIYLSTKNGDGTVFAGMATSSRLKTAKKRTAKCIFQITQVRVRVTD